METNCPPPSKILRASPNGRFSTGTVISPINGVSGGVLKFNLATQTPAYQQVAAGATKTYDLYGTVSGYTTGSTITISLGRTPR